MHQGTPEEAADFFRRWGGARFARIADPTRQLYSAFELKRATVWQAFGFPMWARGLDAAQRGYALGRIAGDAWQMPGCFILHRGKILSSFPYDMVSDRPDYLAFMDDALSRSQQLQLLPDGTLLSPPAPEVLGAWTQAQSAAEPLSTSPTPLTLRVLGWQLKERLRQGASHPRSEVGRLALALVDGISVSPGHYIPPSVGVEALNRFCAQLPVEQWFLVVPSLEGPPAPSQREGQAGQPAWETGGEGTSTALRRLLPPLLAQAPGGLLLFPGPPPGIRRWVRGAARRRPGVLELELWVQDQDKAEAPLAVSFSPLGAPWESLPDPALLPRPLTLQSLRDSLLPLLEKVAQRFQDGALEAHWQYHPEDGFTLLGFRPLAAGVRMRRMLSSALIRELSPPIPSPLMVDVVVEAGRYLTAALRSLDGRLSIGAEPLVVRENGRAFLNGDALAGVATEWGLNLRSLTPWVGGCLPETPWNLWRILDALPVWWRLFQSLATQRPQAHSVLVGLRERLQTARSRQALLEWYGQAMIDLGGAWTRAALTQMLTLRQWPMTRPGATFTLEPPGHSGASPERKSLLDTGQPPPPHRVLFEADPAWPRAMPDASEETLLDFPPDPLDSLGWRGFWPLASPTVLRAHRRWLWDGLMRLLAVFRARLLRSTEDAVQAGLLEDAESIWSLGLPELLQPETQWASLLALPRRAGLVEPPALFFQGEEEQPLPWTVPPCILRAGAVEARAVVASLPQQALKQLKKLEGPALLIVPALGPGWEAVLPKVSGVVAELGGTLSDPPGLELLPASAPIVFNVGQVSRWISPGAAVRLSWDGRLELCSSPLPSSTH